MKRFLIVLIALICLIPKCFAMAYEVDTFEEMEFWKNSYECSVNDNEYVFNNSTRYSYSEYLIHQSEYEYNKEMVKYFTQLIEEYEKEQEQKKLSQQRKISLGRFLLTAYCNCSKCCGSWAGGPTASGVMPQAGRTIAVDLKVISFGTKIMINNHVYVAEDTGDKWVQGNHIDIFFDDHQEALNFGVQWAEVYKIVD